MMQAALHGRLGGDPVQRETRNGNTMVTASVAVAVNRPGDDEMTEWISVVAFGRPADALLRHAKGDLLSAAGSLTKRRFVGRDGQEREQWSLTADSVISARTVRPGGGRKKPATDDGPRRDDRREAEPGLDDDLPF